MEEKFFGELEDGNEFFFKIKGQDYLCRKVRGWMTSTGWSNATIVDSNWIDPDFFVFFENDEIVKVQND